MIGREMWLWLIQHKGQWIIKRATLDKDDWRGSTFSEYDRLEEGRFLTEAELEQLIRKAVEMARERHEGNFLYADYEIVKELMK